MGKRQKWKVKAAEKAAELVEDDMKVGLGSGSTLAEVVKILGEEGSDAEFVVASENTREVAEENGLDIIPLRKDLELDITIDGTDEVDPDYNMIKGGGGAHTREKIVADAAEEVNIVVDRTKLVKGLGEKNPLPAAVIPFATDFLENKLKKDWEDAELRKTGDKKPFITDNENNIIDIEIVEIEKPEDLEKELNKVPGIVENGIFTDLADRVFIGYEDGVETIETKEEFLKAYEKLSEY